MADQEEPAAPVSVQVIELTAAHMAYVLANVIANVLTGVPQEHRQNVFYALSGVALESADSVVRGLPEDLTRQVQQAARIHVESSLDTVAHHLGLKAPENDGGGPTAH
jgi:hypothetical protein